MRPIVIASIFSLLAVGYSAPAAAQPPVKAPAAPQPVDPQAVVAEVRRRIAENYVLPEKRPALDKVLAAGLASGRYKVKDPATLAARINEDLARVGQDGHLNFSYDPQRPPMPAPGPGPMPEAMMKEMQARARASNHGIRSLRMLPGNVRYMELSSFESAGPESEAAHAEAMKFLAGGEAVIIDVRRTPGGNPAAVRYITSHFIEAGTHLITFKAAGMPDGIGESLPDIPNRMVGKPLYVLTSSGSASAAEEFVGHVAGFKVGEVVGETTAGAGFRNQWFEIPGGFALSVSVGRAILASTGKDWERVGISPTIPAPVLRALEVAHGHALRRLAAATPNRRARLEGMAEGVQARIAARAPALPLTAYAGRYSGAAIEIDSGRLYFRREGGAPFAMVPLGENRFTLEDEPAVRMTFHPQGNAVTGFDFGPVDGPVLARHEREAPKG
jgi:hypothetical protein